jgi:hypothetical protein
MNRIAASPTALPFEEEFFVVARGYAGRALCDRRGEY